MLFDGLPPELPTATLLRGAALARHRVLRGHLRQWLGVRWAWLRPRTVPMIAALVGMIAVIATTKCLSTYAASAPQGDVFLDGEGAAPDSTDQARDHASAHWQAGIVLVRSGSQPIALEP